jgi:putative membrane protein
MRKSLISKTALLGLAFAGALFAGTSSFAQQAPAKSDSVHANDWAWMEKANRAGVAEIQAGQIAASKATNPKVREFAQKMVDEHTKANEELKAIASSKGITLPGQPDATHKKELAKLEKFTPGSRFDEEYVTRAGVIDHQDAVKHFKRGTTNVRDADIKAYAQKTLPTIESHLAEAKKLNG